MQNSSKQHALQLTWTYKLSKMALSCPIIKYWNAYSVKCRNLLYTNRNLLYTDGVRTLLKSNLALKDFAQLSDPIGPKWPSNRRFPKNREQSWLCSEPSCPQTHIKHPISKIGHSTSESDIETRGKISNDSFMCLIIKTVDKYSMTLTCH